MMHLLTPAERAFIEGYFKAQFSWLARNADPITAIAKKVSDNARLFNYTVPDAHQGNQDLLLGAAFIACTGPLVTHYKETSNTALKSPVTERDAQAQVRDMLAKIRSEL